VRANNDDQWFGARGERRVGSGECRPVAFGLAHPVAQRNDDKRETEGPAGQQATHHSGDSSGGDVSAVTRRGARHNGAEAAGGAEGTANVSGAR
jgi:hypothetical protein